MMSKIWRTLIKQEILTAFHSSGESANTQASPAEDISISSSGVATQDPEPMEAQEMNTTTQVESSQIVDLTNTIHLEITG